MSVGLEYALQLTSEVRLAIEKRYRSLVAVECSVHLKRPFVHVWKPLLSDGLLEHFHLNILPFIHVIVTLVESEDDKDPKGKPSSLSAIAEHYSMEAQYYKSFLLNQVLGY